MGDMLTLIEKAEQVYEKEEAEKAAAKLFEGEFTFEDFLDQLQQVKKMGPLNNLVGMIPGLPKEVKNQEIDDREIGRIEAIIRSMTPLERGKPGLIDGSRRSRIASGSGVQPGDVSALIKQFQDVKKMMQKMGNIPGLGRKVKKARGKAKAGGRVTPKGTKPVDAKPSGAKPPPFTIPGVGDDSLPGLN
jgi:signal recognition particle subunit SRP54